MLHRQIFITLLYFVALAWRHFKLHMLKLMDFVSWLENVTMFIIVLFGYNMIFFFIIKKIVTYVEVYILFELNYNKKKGIIYGRPISKYDRFHLM